MVRFLRIYDPDEIPLSLFGFILNNDLRHTCSFIYHSSTIKYSSIVKEFFTSRHLLIISNCATKPIKGRRDRRQSCPGEFYKVCFDYCREPFLAGYRLQNHPQYHTRGYEWAVVEQEVFKSGEPDFIPGCQGIPLLMRHWRGLVLSGALLALSRAAAGKKQNFCRYQNAPKGRWVQKVYQVDDGPRCEALAPGYVDGATSGSRPAIRRCRAAGLPNAAITMYYARRPHLLTDKGWMYGRTKVSTQRSRRQTASHEKGYRRVQNRQASVYLTPISGKNQQPYLDSPFARYGMKFIPIAGYQ